MVEFFTLSASGTDLDASGSPTVINAQARVTLDCTSIIVRVFDTQNNLLFEDVVPPGVNITPINGVNTKLVTASFDNSVAKIACGERVKVSMACESDPIATLDDATVAVGCKDNPPQPCPDSNVLGIILTDDGGNVITPDQLCLQAGTFGAEVTGVPAGSQIFWTLEVAGNTTSLGSANPTQFTIGAGTASAILSAMVIIPNCPPILKSLALPDRLEGDCPSVVTFEITKDGQVVNDVTDLAPGTYQINVLSPLGVGHSYTFSDDGGVIQFGPSPSASFVLLGNGAENTITVSVTSGDCCPVLSVNRMLESDPDAETPPDVIIPPDDDDDDDGGFDWPSLCGIIYGILMVAVVAFIALWIASFTLFPASTAIWVALAVAFGVVLVALAVYVWVCNVSWCRRMRILGWMFAWCALGCIIAWVASLFTLWFLLIGALIAGLIAMVIGILMARRNCDFLNLIGLP